MSKQEFRIYVWCLTGTFIILAIPPAIIFWDLQGVPLLATIWALMIGWAWLVHRYGQGD